MTKILICGGNGLIGRAITDILLKSGQEVVWLSRKPVKYKTVIVHQWDPYTGFIEKGALHDVKSIVFLQGASIAGKRWTAKYQREILSSRIQPVQFLFDQISSQGIDIENVVGASAVGFYGARTDEALHQEEESAYTDFIGKTCKEWESSYKVFSDMNIPLTVFRLGVVFSPHGGAYPSLSKVFSKGLGAIMGSGDQYMPWVHVEDAADVFVKAILQRWKGTYNLAAGNVRNKELTHSLLKVFHRRKIFPPVPEFILRMVLGEAACMLTQGCAVSNSLLLSRSVQFKFTDFDQMLLRLQSGK